MENREKTASYKSHTTKIILGVMIMLMVVSMVSAKTRYTPTSETICDGLDCRTNVYSSTTYVQEDGNWKHYTEARSLKDKGFEEYTIEKDLDYPVEVVDFNATHGTFDLHQWAIFNEDVRLRLWQPNRTKVREFVLDCDENHVNPQGKYTGHCNVILNDRGEGTKYGVWKKYYKEFYDMYSDEYITFNLFDFGDERITREIELGSILEFGPNSTVVVLDSSSIIKDTYLDEYNPNTNHGNSDIYKIYATNVNNWLQNPLITWDISGLVNQGIIINNASLSLRQTYSGMEVGDRRYGSIHQVWNNFTYNETNITWNSGLPVSGTDYNSTYEDRQVIDWTIADGQRVNWTVTNMLQDTIDNNYVNFTTYITSSYYTGNWIYNQMPEFGSSSYADSSYRPLLSIEYTNSINVTLNSPVDNYNSTNQTVEFNCSAESTASLNNMSLWTNKSGSWAAEETVQLLNAFGEEYHLIIYADSIDEAAIEINDVVVTDLGSNKWKINSTESDDNLSRAKVMGTLFFGNYNANGIDARIYNITNISKITSNNPIDNDGSVYLHFMNGTSSGCNNQISANITFSNGSTNYISHWAYLGGTDSQNRFCFYSPSNGPSVCGGANLIASSTSSTTNQMLTDQTDDEGNYSSAQMQFYNGNCGSFNVYGRTLHLVSGGNSTEDTTYVSVTGTGTILQNLTKFMEDDGIPVIEYQGALTNYNAIFNTTITGSADWTCQACDINDACVFASENRTVNYVSPIPPPPVVSLISPVDNFNTNNSLVTFECNATNDPDNMTLILDGVDNETTNYSLECYQETANASDPSDGSCGLVYTGSYTKGNDNWVNYDKIFNANWAETGVEAYNTLGGSDSEIYINYTIPSSSTGAEWKVRHDELPTVNTTFEIPSACFSYGDTLQLRMISDDDFGSASLYLDCYNGTWDRIYDSGAGSNNGDIIEEGITWSFNPVSFTKSLSEGAHTWTCSATNANSTETATSRSLIVDLTAPNVTLIAPENDTYISGELCYQESATVSNQTGIDGDCGLNYSGNYLVTNDTQQGYFYINYTKPENVNVGLAVWKLKLSNKFSAPSYEGYDINVTVPSSCFNYDANKLIFKVDSSSLAPFVIASCFDGSWNTLANYTKSGGTAGAGDNPSNMYDGNWYNGASYRSDSDTWTTAVLSKGILYEEAIIWYMSQATVNFTANISALSSNTECYQETANISTACGGLDTGIYEFTDDNTQGFMYINYTKPFNVISTKWALSLGWVSQPSYRFIQNVTLPNSCFDYDPDTIILRIRSNSSFASSFAIAECYNSSWVYIGSVNHGSGATIPGQDDRYRSYDGDWNTGVAYGPNNDNWDDFPCSQGIGCINEEAMIWEISETAALDNATLYIYNETGLYNQTTWSLGGLFESILGIPVLLLDGVYTWYYEVLDLAGNLATSEVRTLTIDTINPNITLISPANNSNLNNGTDIFFNYSVVETNPANSTLWINDAFVETVNGTGDFSLQNLSDGNYNWTVSVTDLANQESVAAPFFFSLDATEPNITFITTSPLPFGRIGLNVTFLYNVTDPNADTCYYIYDSGPVTVSCNSEFSFLLSEQFNVTLYANDTSGNNASEFFNWTYTAWENNVTYDEQVLSGDTTTITSNITSSILPTWVLLTYNDVNYTPVVTTDGTNYILTNNLTAPIVTSDQNVSFYYTYSLAGTEWYSAEYNQTVDYLYISGNCSEGNFLLMNVSNYDEKLLTPLNGTVEYILSIENNDQTITEINGSYTGSDLLCTNQNISGIPVQVSLQLRYFADNYVYETYNIQDAPTSELPFNIDLYFLNSTQGTEFKINYKDFDYLRHPGAIINVQRQYLDEGIYRVVEAPLIGADGQATASFDRDNIKYKIIVIENGEVIDTFNDVFPVCQSIVLGTCEINLRGAQDTTTTTSGDFTYTLEKTDTALVLTYTIPSGVPTSVTFETVQNSRYLGNISECNSSVFGSGGTISCGYNATVGDSIIDVTILKGDDTLYGSVYVGEDLSGFFLLNNYVIGFVLLLSLILMFLASGVMIVIISAVGLVYLGMIFLIEGISVSAIIYSVVWLLLAAVVAIYKMAQKEERT